MNRIVFFTALILVSSIVLGGMTHSAQAQSDPLILLKIAKKAHQQLESQMTQDTSEKTKQLFVDGTQNIKVLEESLKNNDTDLAKKQFLSTMKIFKEISQQLTNNKSSQVEKTIQMAVDPSTDLLKMQDYVVNLKKIAKNYNTSIDFSELDLLFVTAKKQINNENFGDALKTITKIKQITIGLNNEIREHASKLEQLRAKEYAERYLEQLDRLIENAKSQGLSNEIIQKLETARESLFVVTDTNEIIKQIKEIISIKEKFELTKNDQLESKVMQIEKSLLKLSHSDKINKTDLKDAKKILEIIKRHLSQGEFEKADESLQSLSIMIEKFQN